jgi:hypothetical protein
MIKSFFSKHNACHCPIKLKEPNKQTVSSAKGENSFPIFFLAIKFRAFAGKIGRRSEGRFADVQFHDRGERETAPHYLDRLMNCRR